MAAVPAPIVNIVTKSGTNSLHGKRGGVFPQIALSTRVTISIQLELPMGSPNPKAPFHNNQYGASLGGPIIKDKTFFYLDYEGPGRSQLGL